MRSSAILLTLTDRLSMSPTHRGIRGASSKGDPGTHGTSFPRGAHVFEDFGLVESQQKGSHDEQAEIRPSFYSTDVRSSRKEDETQMKEEGCEHFS